MNKLPHCRRFLSALNTTLSNATFSGFNVDDAFTSGGGLAQRTENGIITSVILFPYFIATSYRFNGVDKPGPSFDIPDADTTDDKLKAFTDGIIKRIS